MKVSHRPAELFAAFDARVLIAHAGLVPTIRLAERCGLPALLAEKVKLAGAGKGSRLAGPISCAKYGLEVPVDGGGPMLMITGVTREPAA
ncbi:hypothetical protein [Streptomyces sp. NPDC001933]|uniref:hypothetical protein n=1 Tax=Streptomyces sp. NPDC001933 TaxID=3364626 RepID=UPI0036A2FC93